MATTYPSSKQTFTDPQGTSLLTSPDHASLHTTMNDTVESIQDTVGTTAGTNVLKNFTAGDFPSRINSSGVLQQTIQGTLNNATLGSPTATSGTFNTSNIRNATVGTPAITAGTWSNAQLIGTAQITGGSATNQLFVTGTLSSPISQGTVTGWVESTDSWTRVGSWSLSTTTDVSAFIQKGTRLRYKDTAGTYEYGVVISSTFSGGSTTVGLGTTTDSNIASGTIGNIGYSNQSNPGGYPHWFNYTPTYTGTASMTFSVSNTYLARYSVNGYTCTLQSAFKGTTSGTATNIIYMSLPIAQSTTLSSATDSGAGCGIINNNVRTGGLASFYVAGSIGYAKDDASNYSLNANTGAQSQLVYEI